MKLLNGNKAYSLSGVSTVLDEVQVNSAKLIDGAAMTVALEVTTAAETGLVRLSGVGTSGSVPMTLKIGSNRGTTELSFAGSTSLANIAIAINQVREVTGVSAVVSASTATVLNLRSVDFGTDAYVSVQTLSGSGNATTNDIVINGAAGGANDTEIKDYGVDAIATINGTAATAAGKILTIRTAMLDAEIDLNGAAAQSAANWTSTFSVVGGGTDFAIGSRVDAIGLESINIMDISPSQLGNASDGYLSTLRSGGDQALTGNNMYTAQRIVDDAIKDISTLRGRLGAFQKNVIETNINSLKVTLENVTASESAIRDADFAAETSAMTRAQILVQANTSVLSMANSMPQSVLALLG
jgi:flagellin